MVVVARVVVEVEVEVVRSVVVLGVYVTVGRVRRVDDEVAASEQYEYQQSRSSLAQMRIRLSAQSTE